MLLHMQKKGRESLVTSILVFGLETEGRLVATRPRSGSNWSLDIIYLDGLDR